MEAPPDSLDGVAMTIVWCGRTLVAIWDATEQVWEMEGAIGDFHLSNVSQWSVLAKPKPGSE